MRLVLVHEHEIRRDGRRSFRSQLRLACTAQTFLERVKKAEVDSGKRAGVHYFRPLDGAR